MQNGGENERSKMALRERVSLSIVGRDAADAVNRIVEAERAGVRQIWLSMGGGGGTDILTVVAIAAARTSEIGLGTAIVPTYPRHPIVMAQQALAVHDIAPGRLRLGIGPSHRPIIEGSYGLKLTTPLAHLREYMTVLRGLLSQGKIEYHGKFFNVKGSLRSAPVPLLVSALGKGAFELAGEISDGALSWICPVPYLLRDAAPALRAGAQNAQRPAPPLVAHIPVMLTTDEAAVMAQGRALLQRYLGYPFYVQMFEQAGLPATDEASFEKLIRTLVISGDQQTLCTRLTNLLAQGLDELMIHPLPLTNEAERERKQLLELFASIG